MQPAPTSEGQHTTDFADYTWIPGARAKWDAACVRAAPDGRRYVGVKGYDRKHGAPGYISIPVEPAGIKALIAALEAAL